MAKGNILKEAIADAKTVREVALQNAKSALEEAFTPKLQNMLSAKLSEDLDEMYYDEDEKDMDEMYYDEDEKDMDEDMDEGHGMYDEDEKDSMDEEIDLEEILNELELEEGKKADEKEEIDEAKDDDKDDVKEAKDDEEELEEAHYVNPKASDVQSIDYGTKVNEDEEFDLDSLLKEINSLDETPVRGAARKGMRVTKSTRKAIQNRRMNENNRNQNTGCREQASKLHKVTRELNETKKAFTTIQNELNEVNLLNSKLLYVNRIFKANHLDEAQKLRVVETLDKADSTKEAKLIYETIKDTFNVAKSKKASNKKQTKTIKENFKGMASKAAGVSRTKNTAPKRAIISESDNLVNRFQKLANIKISE